jgi:hypothetical protein
MPEFFRVWQLFGAVLVLKNHRALVELLSRRL